MSGTFRPGFADPVDQAQRVFRAVLTALSEPGRVIALAPQGLDALPPFGEAALAIGLSLIDRDTPLWCDAAAHDALPYLAFHTGVPAAKGTGDAAFAMIAEAANLPDLAGFDLGTDEYPDRSTTLIVEVPSLTEGSGFTLSGPGIRETHRLAIGGLPADFIARRAALAPQFPRGVDFLFTCGNRIAGLPRTTVVEA